MIMKSQMRDKMWPWNREEYEKEPDEEYIKKMQALYLEKLSKGQVEEPIVEELPDNEE